MPSAGDLKKRKSSSLSSAIFKHGGYPAVAARLGLGRVTGKLLAACADEIISVVIALDLPDTAPLWEAARRRWMARDLDVALAAFAADGSLDAFRNLLADP